jgi:hypothetical protein
MFWGMNNRPVGGHSSDSLFHPTDMNSNNRVVSNGPRKYSEVNKVNMFFNCHQADIWHEVRKINVSEWGFLNLFYKWGPHLPFIIEDAPTISLLLQADSYVTRYSSLQNHSLV